MEDRGLAELFEGLEDSRQHDATVPILIYGEPGIGKTTLLRTFRDAISPKVLVASSSFTERVNLLPLQPIAEWIEQLSHRLIPGPSTLTEKVESILGPNDRDGLAAILPVVAEAPWEAESYDIFWALRRFLAGCSEAGPIVLLLDDVHEADAHTYEFLTTLGARYAGALLIVCTAEPSMSTSVMAGFPWRSLLLHPLERSESERIAATFPISSLGSPVIEELVDAAGGNPLLLVESLAAGLNPARDVDTGRVVAAAREGLGKVLEIRLEGLSIEATKATALIAIAGQPLTLDQVQQLLPDIDGRRVLEELSLLGILELAPGEAYRLRHRLLGAVLYERQELSTLATTHERIAGFASELAHHHRSKHFEAHHLELASKAYREMGEPSSSEIANRAARIHLSIGQELLQSLDSIMAADHLWSAIDLTSEPKVNEESLFALTYALLEYGHYGEALELVEGALSDGTHPLPIQNRLRVTRHLLRAVGNLPIDLDETDRELQNVIDQEDLDPIGEAYAYDALAYVRFLALRGAGLTTAWTRTLDLATVAGDRYLAGKAMFQLVQAYAYGPTPVAEGIPLALGIVDRSNSLRVRGAGLMSLAGLYAMEGSFEEAESMFNQAASIFYEMNVPYSIGIGACGVYLMSDEPRRALSYLQGDYHRYSGRGYEWLRSRICGALALVLWEVDQHRSAVEFAEEARTLSGGKDPHAELLWRAILGKGAAEAGEVQVALSHERDLLALLGDCDFLPERSSLLLQVSELRLLLGHEAEATEAAEEAVLLAFRKGISLEEDRVQRLFKKIRGD